MTSDHGTQSGSGVPSAGLFGFFSFVFRNGPILPSCHQILIISVSNAVSNKGQKIYDALPLLRGVSTRNIPAITRSQCLKCCIGIGHLGLSGAEDHPPWEKILPGSRRQKNHIPRMIAHPVWRQLVWILLRKVISNLKTFLANASRNGCLRRSLDISKCLADCGYDLVFMHFDPNDERIHHYQRQRASITGLRL